MNTYLFGTVVEMDGVSPGLITIRDGMIVEFRRTSDITATGVRQYDIELYDLDRYRILPGFIDIHACCCGSPGCSRSDKENYLTAGLAALSGGITFIADVPDDHTLPTDQTSYDARQQLAAANCPCPVLCHGGIGPHTEPFSDRVPYKVYMASNIDRLSFRDNSELIETIARYKGLAVSFHCEDAALLEVHKNETGHEHRRPPICEYTAISMVLDLICKYEIKGRICHVSTARGLELIRQAKSGGVNVVADVAPHHLYFDTKALTREKRSFLQVNPPIRPAADRIGLLYGVRSGLIDHLVSNHIPYTIKEKLRGASGVPSLDTYGSFVTWLNRKADVAWERIFHLACNNPGTWVGSFTGSKVGRIAPGYEANITILDLKSTAADGRPLYTRCGWSPYDLRSLPGVVAAVYLRGEKVVDNAYIRSELPV